jgi:hypothetical protein
VGSLSGQSALVILPAERGDVARGETLQAIMTGLPRRPDSIFAD